ncbi:hypothetical protein AAFF_G00094010 [Aldrovandia affinis]|uniref:Uncharacterized protein n=1 Tax=Aldrovandia affinis TaxID=143900 RepID=A0AAD7T2X0_9TELE|nr:hypothetical protein AAFF_G00094010 [Aldrovandia affinis]
MTLRPDPPAQLYKPQHFPVELKFSNLREPESQPPGRWTRRLRKTTNKSSSFRKAHLHPAEAQKPVPSDIEKGGDN